MKPLAEIRAVLHAHAADLRERYGITELAVFGSVARGEATEDSDVDILVSFDRPIGLLKLANAERYLSDLLGRKVDLVRRPSVRPELRGRILSEAVAV